MIMLGDELEKMIFCSFTMIMSKLLIVVAMLMFGIRQKKS